MGQLKGMAYATKLFLKLADHTYVECGTGARGWSCWGGKTGGHQITSGSGSTNRANAIAEPDEKANIKCYLVNGVCHQAANRILSACDPVTTVSAARGYPVSEALYGTYGHSLFWPCHGPFKKYLNVHHDLPECASGGQVSEDSAGAASGARTDDVEYIQSVLTLYEQYSSGDRELSSTDASVFHTVLFMHMVRYRLGEDFDADRLGRLEAVYRSVERRRSVLNQAYSNDELPIREFAERVDDLTIAFQDEVAENLAESHYRILFNLDRDERVTLADPQIIERLAE